MSQSSLNPASQGAPAMGASGGSDMSQGPGADPGQGGGFVIILAFQDDGSIQVMQQGGDASQDGGSGGSDQSQPQVVNSLQDAFQAIQQLAQQNGYQDQGGDDSDSGADGNEMLSPDDAASAWNKMAAKKDQKRAMGM